jgi:hypothetical protein
VYGFRRALDSWRVFGRHHERLLSLLWHSVQFRHGVHSAGLALSFETYGFAWDFVE